MVATVGKDGGEIALDGLYSRSLACMAGWLGWS
jgi:hypothetical protein